MGVGRNLAYSKDLFFKMKGFSTHYHINSGDDDLFVNTAANNVNTNICVSINSITCSKPKLKFKDWRLQKARHITTSPLYNSNSKLKLAFGYFAQYFFYLSIIPLVFQLNTLIVFASVFILKSIIFMLILNKAAKKLNEKDLLVRGVFLELILLFIYPIFHLTKIIYKPAKWTN